MTTTHSPEDLMARFTDSQTGRSADVLRRQADGSFRVAIDHP